LYFEFKNLLASPDFGILLVSEKRDDFAELVSFILGKNGWAFGFKGVTIAGWSGDLLGVNFGFFVLTIVVFQDFLSTIV
jgi:hypothetical protein